MANDKSGIDKANEKRKFWRPLAAVGGGLATAAGVVVTIASLGQIRSR